MAHVFRHKQNKQLYTIEHLLVDLKFANLGGNTGIYAVPYKWPSNIITHTKDQARMRYVEEFNPKKFVIDNFEIVAEL